MADEGQSRRGGLWLGLTAYLLWGFLPLYFKFLDRVSPVEIVAHRIFWSVVVLALAVSALRRWPAIRAALTCGQVLTTLVVTSLLIAANWLVYVYSIVSNQLLEGSLGYYLNPLANVLLGVVFLKERLTRLQIIACLLAAAGVAMLAAGAGSGLWISFSLAISFSLYGFLRKIVSVDALEGLWIETAILAPVALGWILFVQHRGTGGLGAYGLATDALLILAGGITAIPLLLFTAAARRLPYSTLGFLQYVAPSLQFLLAVLAFGEPLTRAHAACFAAIWVALAIFSVEGLRLGRARAAAAA
ncbi:MAG TPA: EamA family transporter RarD [Allosphingosinicella sp.]|jgi:chloramphenicol-sensitive protein RarD